MAAQYDVNLEKCVLLKCMCGEWKLNSALAAGQAPGAAWMIYMKFNLCNVHCA